MYCSVRIGAPSEKEARHISKRLVQKKLVAGTMISSGDCHYWWDRAIIQKKYWNITAYSTMARRKRIIEEVKKNNK